MSHIIKPGPSGVPVKPFPGESRAEGFRVTSLGKGLKVWNFPGFSLGPMEFLGCCLNFKGVYSRSQKVGNLIASILKSNVEGIPALFGLNPVSNFWASTVDLAGRVVLFLDSGL